MADYETIKRMEQNIEEITYLLGEVIKVPIVNKDLLRRKVLELKKE